MYKQFYQTLSENLLALPIFALAVFILVFARIVVRAMRRPATELQALAVMPLSAEEREVNDENR